MKLKKLLGVIISAVLCFANVQAAQSAFAESDNSSDSLTDSGINYTESTETISNPGAGYTTTLWYTCKPGDTPIKNPSGNLVLMFVNIGPFSSGANGTTDEDENYTEGTDYDLDESFFTGLRGTLENCRKNGSTVAIRFRYDDVGKTNPEPATFDQLLKHISQIKENGVLEDYKDILMFVETGFVGAWGEQHSGKYTSLEYKAQLVDAMLDMVPKEIPITVRTPNTFAKWAGIAVSDIDSWVSEPGSDAARIGLYNDGYMGSDSDLGTYSNREKETTWLGNQTVSTYYGGEFSGNLTWAQKYTTYLPENALPEMYKTHLSYINSNIYNLYNDYTYDESYDTTDADNSAYYGETVYKFIRDHIGYRFVLRDSQLSSEVSQGGTLSLNISVENTGFANPIRQQKAEVILEQNGSYITTQCDIDTRQWLSCTTTDTQLEIKLPGGLEPGKWNVYLRFSVGNSDISNQYMRTVKFANNGIWNTSLGANFVGSVNVAESENVSQITDNSFYQVVDSEPFSLSDADMYTVNDMVIMDGVRSSDFEWTDSLLAAESGDNKLYITNDDKYLYIMAEIVQSAQSPVYNLQIRNGSEDDKFYWLYYQSNGFVYFNNGSSDGCECKRSGNYVEFQIPFGSVMNIEPGTVLSSVRVSIQDSSNEWVNVGEVTAKDYTVTDTFYIYSACKSVNLKQHDSISFGAACSLDTAQYQWLFNGEEIAGANSREYTVEDASADDCGTYSVQITAESGAVKTADICIINNVYSGSLKGDVNGDGTVNTADTALLGKYLTCTADISELVYDNCDMNDDSAVNIFDLVMVKRIVCAD